MEQTNVADVFRVIIIVLAFLFAGQSLWFFARTRYTSAKMILAGMLCISAASVSASWVSMGTSSPGWIYLIGMPVGYILVMLAMAMWRRERGIMAHDVYFVKHKSHYHFRYHP